LIPAAGTSNKPATPKIFPGPLMKARLYKIMIAPARRTHLCPKVTKHPLNILTLKLAIPHEDGMPSIWKPVQFGKIAQDLSSHRIQMNVADEFEEIRFFFNHYALVPILEQMAFAVMPPIVPDSITGHQSTHHCREAHPVGPKTKKKMKVIGHEAPSKQLGISLRNQIRKSLEECLSILLVPKDVPALNTTGHHMLKNIRNIKSRASRHRRILVNHVSQVNNNLQFLPTSPIFLHASEAALRLSAGPREREKG